MTDIVILAPSLNPHAGGVERFSFLLRDVVRSAGFTAEVVCPPQMGRRPGFLDKLGLKPILDAVAASAEIRSHRPQLVVTNGTLGVLRGVRVDRIHVYHGTMPAHSLAEAGRRPMRDWLVRGLIAGGLAEFLSGFGAVRVAVSISVAREMWRFYRLHAHEIISNGVPVPEIEKRERRGLVFVGRREIRKGYAAALDVAAKLGERLAVAGPGESPETENLGILDSEQLSSVYMTSAVMLFPSRYEGCSFAILEALAAGCPVVTTPVGWIPELLEAVPLYHQLVRSVDDVDALSAAVERVIRRDAVVLQAVTDAHEYVARHNSIDLFAIRWTGLISQVLDIVPGSNRPNEEYS